MLVFHWEKRFPIERFWIQNKDGRIILFEERDLLKNLLLRIKIKPADLIEYLSNSTGNQPKITTIFEFLSEEDSLLEESSKTVVEFMKDRSLDILSKYNFSIFSRVYDDLLSDPSIEELKELPAYLVTRDWNTFLSAVKRGHTDINYKNVVVEFITD